MSGTKVKDELGMGQVAWYLQQQSLSLVEHLEVVQGNARGLVGVG